MPSFVTHLVIPPLVLASMGLVSWRYVVFLAPVAVLPDLDFFIPPHRAFLTNVWWPVLLGLAAWRLRHHGRREWLAAAVGCYYWSSHVLMDLFVGGVVPFWPFLDRTFLLFLAIVVDTRTLEREYVAEAGTYEGIPAVSETFVWLSPQEVAIAALVAATLVAALGGQWLARRRLALRAQAAPAGPPASAPRRKERPRRGKGSR